MNLLEKHKWLQWLVMLAALEMIVLSLNFFYVPAGIAAGGSTGIAILLDKAFHFNRALSVLVINFLMIGLAFIFLKRHVIAKIVFGSFAIPLLMWLTPTAKLVDDPLLAMVIAGSVFGFGIALLYHVGASSGGSTVPPMILKKFFNLNTSVGLLIIDGLIIICNIFVSGSNAFFLAIFSQVITTIVMRYIESGFDHKKMFSIMSETHLLEIKQLIEHEFDHGFTILQVVGGKSKDDKEMLIVVVKNADYRTFIREVKRLDPKAFITSSNITEVHGGITGIYG
ncbi:MAG: YitT family protein [Oenococcus sp.]|uniref:YitT family protein n=1 Tax=Oenococcus sp. TaxID=1979414 RepID=UPI0039ECFD31